jgi:hypothetical protein
LRLSKQQLRIRIPVWTWFNAMPLEVCTTFITILKGEGNDAGFE